MAETTEKAKKDDGLVWLYLLAVAFGLLILIPTLLAFSLFWLLRNKVGKMESGIIFATGFIGMLLGSNTYFKSYFSWLTDLFTGHHSRLAIPWISLLLFAFFIAGIMLLLQDTRVASFGLARFAKKSSPFDEESIIPTLKQKQRSQVVAPPGSALTIDASSHSIIADVPSGQRSFPVGVDKAGTPVLISEDEIRMHGLIFGSTGSGKSKTIEAVAGGLLDLGWDGMIIDLKEDAGLQDWCKTYAEHHSIPYQSLGLSETNPDFWFNPLLGMGPDEARDAILGMNEFEAAYWEAINKKQLGQICSLMWDANAIDPVAFPVPSMKDIGSILSSSSIGNATKKMVATVVVNNPLRTKEDYSSLVSPSKDEAMAAVGLGAKLIAMYETNAGRTVLTPSNKRRSLDVTQKGLTYIGLDSLGKADLTKMASAAMLLRMSVYAAERTTKMASKKPSPRFLIVDEANFINRTIVMNILSRARSAGIAMILATQGPLDFGIGSQPGQPGFGSLAQNTNVAIIMSQGELENAEVCAGYIGKKERKSLPQSMRDGELFDSGSIRSERDFIVSPDDLRNMGIGEAILRIGKPVGKVTWMGVRVRDPRTSAFR